MRFYECALPLCALKTSQYSTMSLYVYLNSGQGYRDDIETEREMEVQIKAQRFCRRIMAILQDR